METPLVEYQRLKEKLNDLEPGSDAYDKTLDQLNKLVHIMVLVEKNEPKSKMSRFFENQALVNASAMLALGFATLYHERLNIVTSRVFGMVKFR